MPMVRYESAAGRFPTPRVPRANMGDLYHINADEFVQARLRWGAGGDAGSRYIRFLNGTFRPISGGKTRGERRLESIPFRTCSTWTGGLPLNKEKSEKKSAERSRAPRSPKSVRLIVERHYIGNVPMNTLFQRLAEEEIRKPAESYLAAG